MVSSEAGGGFLPNGTSLVNVVGLVASCSLLYWLGVAIYNLYFHPLAKFPGPFLARSTLAWRIYQTQSGRIHKAIYANHQKYGSVFRVSPNELSFASASSWKGIYGHQPGGKQPIKSEFYDMYGSGFKSLCIGSERNPLKHRQMKSSLSAAFSTKALTEQESIVAEAVEAFIARIGKDGGPASPEGLNMVKWYEMIAFDILGSMAFGESFNCVEDGEPHFWQEMVFDHIWFITLADNLRRLPFVITIARTLAPVISAVSKKHTGYTRQKVADRLSRKKDARKDFMSNLVAKVESGEIDREEMTAHASTLIVAGGETVATSLAATTYFLLKNPLPYSRVKQEVRQRFQTYDSIDATSAQQLPYLQAVIQEGLRIFPPGSQGFPRLSNGQMIDDHWIPEGTEVYTSAWAVTHDAEHFHEPFKFHPSRWLHETSEDIKEASQPFSLGPRGCLGRNFALMELNLIYAKLFWKYDMELVRPDFAWDEMCKCGIMWEKPPLLVRFHSRADI